MCAQTRRGISDTLVSLKRDRRTSLVLTPDKPARITGCGRPIAGIGRLPGDFTEYPLGQNDAPVYDTVHFGGAPVWESRRASWPRFKSGCVSSPAFHRLAAHATPAYRQKGEVLFAEGQPSHGVFLLSLGRVKIFTASADGKIFVLKFAGPGEILGLAGTLSRGSYETSAEAVEPAHVGFVERKDLVNVIRHDGEVAMQVALQLSDSYSSAIAGLRTTGLSWSASQRLAMFLLDWHETNRALNGGDTPPLSLTHEEISQSLGISRETVSRIVSRFKKKGLIQSKGRNLVLRNRSALESSATS